MKLTGNFRVVGIEGTRFEGIIRVRMISEGNVEVSMEYPVKAVGVELRQDYTVNLSIDTEKDPNYRANWDVYMNGMVYYVGNGIVKISIGGLIIDVINYNGDAKVGERVYVGLKITPSHPEK
ncbi:hypothetical protein [Vulcanisaeta thermophila]|uniref:hypothetical protein n=1 Tax=Vulcanisaeta thermophila TaxID=867917 RepID=UPI000853AAEC|nr:hypothetical protein [Vulcanisaeta thermophila]